MIVPEGTDKEKYHKNVDNLYNKLPSLVKSEGVEKVQKAAGYLPFIDGSTMTTTEREGKGGRALAPKIRFKKPLFVTKQRELFKKLGVPDYDAEVVGKVGGALFKTKGKSPFDKVLDKAKEHKDKINYLKSGEVPEAKECGRSGRLNLGGESEAEQKNESKSHRAEIIARIQARKKNAGRSF